jgi:hypothetical protein
MDDEIYGFVVVCAADAADAADSVALSWLNLHTIFNGS